MTENFQVTKSALKKSFCVPTFDYGTFIGRAIESVPGKNESGVEIVVLDSGSVGQTRDVVEKLTASHRCVRYFYQVQRGIDCNLPLSETRDLAPWREIERLLAVYGFSSAQLCLINALGKMPEWFTRPSAA